MADGFIHFLGTAGSRYTTIRQLRASGGLWLHYKETNILIDPGPGSLVRVIEEAALDPASLDAVVLTHKHLDHSNDVNIMVEAMTGGGRLDKGVLVVPQDALGPGGVVFEYVLEYPEKIIKISGEQTVKIKDVVMNFSRGLRHGTQTHGITFVCGNKAIALVADTDYFEGLENMFRGNIMIINVLTPDHRDGVDHLCLEEVQKILNTAKPGRALLTHFGIPMLQQDMESLSAEISLNTQCDVFCVSDGHREEF